MAEYTRSSLHQDQSTNTLRFRPRRGSRVREEDEPQDEHSHRGSTSYTGMFYLEKTYVMASLFVRCVQCIG